MLPEAFASPNLGGFLVLALAMPVAGILLVFLAGGRHARRITLTLLVAGAGIAAVIAGGVWRTGDALTYLSGGWSPPLGIKLRADGLSAVMTMVTPLWFWPPVCMRRTSFAYREENPRPAPRCAFGSCSSRFGRR